MNKCAINTFLESLKTKFKSINLDNTAYLDIYRDLRTFNALGDYIEQKNLIGIQIKLSAKYDSDKRLNRIDKKNNGIHFWGIENLCGDDPNVLREKLFDGIKIYVPIEADKIHYITSEIIDFSVKENIPMQIKVAKEMRNDTITMRVTTKEDALKIESFLNEELDYQTKINPNPFLYRKGKIAFAYDGNLSYNTTLSKLLNSYLIDKKNFQTLDSVAVEDFLQFLKNQKVLLNGPNKQFYLDYYNLIDSTRYENFIKIIEMIIKNIEGTMTLEDVFVMQKSNVLNENDVFDYEISIQRTKKVCEIADKLDDYCKEVLNDSERQKKIIEQFINTGSYDVFPVNNNIRNEVRENFTPSLLKDVIWKLLVNALIDTHEKYGEAHYEIAINEMMYSDEEKLSVLTNEYQNRSYLCKLASKKIIKRILEDKALQYNKLYTLNNIKGIIKEEVEFTI